MGPRPDAFDVLAATLHPSSRVVDLGERAVVRTPGQPDGDEGPGIMLLGPPPSPGTLRDAVLELATRFPDPGARRRVVSRRPDDASDDGASAGEASDGEASDDAGSGGLERRPLDVLVLPDPAAAAGSWSRRSDVVLRPPGDGRGWHAVTVLRRHAAVGAGEARARARGGRDDLLRWWVEGRRRLVAEGRARVLVAERFGTPVATGTLAWAPAVEVGTGAAGLAVVTDVVVHPAHRRIGVATSVVGRLLADHLADFPLAAVATIVPATLTPALVHRGWQVHDRLVSAGPGPAVTGEG